MSLPAKRLSLKYPLVLNYSGKIGDSEVDQLMIPADSRNLSATGIGIVSNAVAMFPPVGEALSLQLLTGRGPGRSERLHMVVQVIWKTGRHAGLKILNINDESQRLYAEILHSAENPYSAKSGKAIPTPPPMRRKPFSLEIQRFGRNN